VALSQVRTYLKGKIEAYDSDFNEWLDPAFDNIPATQIDKSYHIEIGAISTSSNDQNLEDDIPVTVRFWRKGYRSVTEAIDLALDDANCIRLSLVNYPSIAQTENIRAVFPTGIETVGIGETNDNTVQVNLTLTLKMFYKTT